MIEIILPSGVSLRVDTEVEGRALRREVERRDAHDALLTIVIASQLRDGRDEMDQTEVGLPDSTFSMMA